jgi:hypothetical protein
VGSRASPPPAWAVCRPRSEDAAATRVFPRAATGAASRTEAGPRRPRDRDHDRRSFFADGGVGGGAREGA